MLLYADLSQECSLHNSKALHVLGELASQPHGKKAMLYATAPEQ